MNTLLIDPVLSTSGNRNRSHIHSRIRENKRATAIKLIHNKWRRSDVRSRKFVRQNEADRSISCKNDEVDCSTNVDETLQPTLLFRRNDPEYGSNELIYPYYTEQYPTVHFLNSSTILGVAPRGHFDIIGMRCGSSSSEGCGKLLSQMRLSATDCDSIRFVPAVHCYERGHKFAVGLLSGDMEIFSTDRSSSEKTKSTLPPSQGLWSNLPPLNTQYIIGPRRRFLKNDIYSLLHMLSITDHEEIMQASNDPSIFTEISCWRDANLRLSRANCSDAYGGPAKPWAFREGGLGSSSALIGVHVDAEMDCFSLRIVDERDNTPTVYVDTTSDPLLNEECINSACFTNDFGLVVGYCGKHLSGNILKFFDLRMIGRLPAKTVNLSFPCNDVVGSSPIQEMTVERRTPASKESGLAGPARLVPFDRTKSLDRDENGRIDKLTGASTSSDHFATSLSHTCGSSHHVIIDFIRGEIVNQVGAMANELTSITSFSSCFESMACLIRSKLQHEGNNMTLLSIYDISKSSTELITSSPHSKKRRLADIDNKLSDGCLVTLEPKLFDLYGLQSDARSIAMDDYGSTIAAVTYDGDYYIMSP